jgi:CheY-like chemotaxis protein
MSSQAERIRNSLPQDTRSVNESRRARPTAPRVLIVDPSERNLTVLGENLPKHGFEVLACSNGEEALSFARTLQPEAILVEARLPDLTVEELLQRVGAGAAPDAPRVFVMAQDPSADEVERWMELGACDVMRKPMFVTEIAERIRMAFRREEKAQTPKLRKEPEASPVASSSLVEYIEQLAGMRRSGTVVVRDPHGRTGYLGLREGNVVFAKLDGLEGEKAAYTILGWESATWEFQTQPPGEENIHISTIGLILESLRWRESKRELLSQLPSPQGPYRLTPRFRSLRQGTRLPAEVYRFLRLLDKGKTVPELLAESPYDERETLEKLVRMVQRRVIEPASAEALGEREAAAEGPVPTSVARAPEVTMERTVPVPPRPKLWLLLTGSERTGWRQLVERLSRTPVMSRELSLASGKIPVALGSWKQDVGLIGIDTRDICQAVLRSLGSGLATAVVLVSALERRKWEYTGYLYEALRDQVSGEVMVAVTGPAREEDSVRLLRDVIRLRPGDRMLFVPEGDAGVLRTAIDAQLELRSRNSGKVP